MTTDPASSNDAATSDGSDYTAADPGQAFRRHAVSVRPLAFRAKETGMALMRNVAGFLDQRALSRWRDTMVPAHPITGRLGQWIPGLLCASLLVGAAIVTFQTAAREEDFWWADGASFALNGEFVRDYIATGLGRNPMAFALDWFRHYPALTISLYPPIFPLTEAAVFSVFGFSHAAAVGTVTLFVALAGYGMYRMMRTTVGLPAATAAGVMLFATPEVLRWSREVVMDVPAMAFLLLAAAALSRYQATKRQRPLLAAVLLTLAAVYTKQTAIFVAPAFVVALLADEGWSLARRKSAWIMAGIGVLGVVPLALFTVFYAPENFWIAVGTETGQREYARLSLRALMAYGRVLPDIVGIVPLVASIAYLAVLSVIGWRDIAERRLTILMVAWFAIDYVIVSVTADFEPRYAMPLTVPAVVLSVLLITRLAAARWSGYAALAVAAGLFVTSVSGQPVSRVEGYGDVAQFVLDRARQDDTVLFHGVGSKNFAFSVRTRSPMPKIYIQRAEKLLVDYSITRDWGITDRNKSAAEVAALIDRYKISYIVFQPNFWTDQPSIAALQRLIDSDRFVLIGQFGITSEDLKRCAVIRVYRVKRGIAGR